MASRSQSLMAASLLRRQNSSLWPYLNDSPSHQMHVWRRAAQSHGRRRCGPSYATVDGRVDGSRVAERASRVRDEQACVSRRGGRTHAVVSSESTTRSECFPCSREAIDKLSAAPHRLAIGKRSFAAGCLRCAGMRPSAKDSPRLEFLSMTLRRLMDDAGQRPLCSASRSRHSI